MRIDDPVGEIILKKIDFEKKEGTLSIYLQNNSVNEKGIGTWAGRQIIHYAFNELNLETVYADIVKKNLRSQHALEKVRFLFLNENEKFQYFYIKKRK
ncbi:MAG: GNAT family N-acetyltransferase [Firmicutes bacterium]|nr:GNAT family N-acetyltransferase [Bacillota bacterium]